MKKQTAEQIAAQEAAQQKAVDKQNIIRLHRVVSPNGNDIALIYELYKKYVNAGARPPRLGGCQTCGNSVANYWRELCKWYNANQSTF